MPIQLTCCWDELRLAIGHQTEAQFNEYLSINEQELLGTYKPPATR